MTYVGFVVSDASFGFKVNGVFINGVPVADRRGVETGEIGEDYSLSAACRCCVNTFCCAFTSLSCSLFGGMFSG